MKIKARKVKDSDDDDVRPKKGLEKAKKHNKETGSEKGI
jgi:hypothetical protein